MKKTLLAVALLAGFASAAQAADSVTLYGLIDAGIGYEKVKFNGNSQSRVGAVQGVSSGSRFGLRGSEDLGDGLRAVFNLEAGFGPLNGNSLQSGRLWGRQATVGLDSDSWGRLEFGRQTNLASKYFGSIDPFSISYNTANMGTVFSSANTMRLDNMVLYQTPSFGGFKAGLGYSFSADDTVSDEKQRGFETNNNNRVLTAGVQYVNGPLNLAAAYDRFNPSKDVKGGSQEDTTIQSYILGGTYDFEVVKIAAAFGQTRNGWFVGQNMGTTPDGMQKLGTFAGRRLPRQFVHGGLHCAAGQQLDLRFLAARRSEERQADQGRCQVQRLQPGLHLRPEQAHQPVRVRLLRRQLRVPARCDGHRVRRGPASPVLSDGAPGQTLLNARPISVSRRVTANPPVEAGRDLS